MDVWLGVEQPFGHPLGNDELCEKLMRLFGFRGKFHVWKVCEQWSDIEGIERKVFSIERWVEGWRGVEFYFLCFPTCQDDLKSARIRLLADFILARAGQRSKVLIHDWRVPENAALRAVLVMSLLRYLVRLAGAIKFPFERSGWRIGMNLTHDIQIFTSKCTDGYDSIGYANGCICKRKEKSFNCNCRGKKTFDTWTEYRCRSEENVTLSLLFGKDKLFFVIMCLRGWAIFISNVIGEDISQMAEKEYV